MLLKEIELATKNFGIPNALDNIPVSLLVQETSLSGHLLQLTKINPRDSESQNDSDRLKDVSPIGSFLIPLLLFIIGGVVICYGVCLLDYPRGTVGRGIVGIGLISVGGVVVFHAFDLAFG